MANFDPPQKPCPLTNYQKFVTGDYVSDPYSCSKFIRGVLGKLVNFYKFFKFKIVLTVIFQANLG